MSKDDSKGQFYFQWHITERCNLRCSHCYQADYTALDLEMTQMRQIFDTLEKALMKWKKSGRISLTGGEPLLDKPRFFKLLNLFDASPHFYWIGVLTNGTLIDKETAKKMTEYPGLKEVQISLDGASDSTHDAVRGTGAFHKAVQGLELLIEHSIGTAVMFTLHKKNRDEALKVIDLCAELGVNALTIERYTPINCKSDDPLFIPASELRDIYNKIFLKKQEIERAGSGLKIRTSRPLWTLTDQNLGGFCPVGFTSLAILHDGTLLPCRRLEVPLGNILTDGIFKVWYTSPVLWEIRDKKRLMGKCQDCTYISRCGGCRAAAYAATGEIMAEDPQCWLEKEKREGK